ncbi:CAP domain-containing protein [Lysinibacillus xylanilyticus]|uniref:CAP domain-containing protein n=1 Tax=Lysinibacillus xylanilyticus TaxID=582475 RepID=UPI003D042CA1
MYLKELNAVRKASGAPELTIDARLSESAQNHAVYLNANGHSLGEGHSEDRNKSGFTGVTVEERFKAVGGSMENYGTLSEALVSSGAGLKTAFEGLLNILLAGYSDTVGIGISGITIVIVTADNKTTDIGNYTSVKYPYNGQTNVDTAYDLASVSSSPLTQYGVSKAGYVIYSHLLVSNVVQHSILNYTIVKMFV